QSTTVHCARCHNHKFDPISQKEYYQLQAVFAGVERGDRALLTKADKAQLAALQAQQTALTAKQSALEQKIKAQTSPELAQLDADLKTWQQALAQLPAVNGAKPSPSDGWHSGIEAKPGVTKWV